MDLLDCELPAAFVSHALTLGSGRHWLTRWKDLAADFLDRWQLSLDLPAGTQPWCGSVAVVLPVRRADHHRAVLKLTIPHEEALPEPAALALWAGRGAVRLLESSPADYVVLLDRLDASSSLAALPLDETTALWGALVKKLSLRPGRAELWRDVPSIAAHAEMLTDTLPSDWDLLGRPFDRWLLEAALEVCQLRGAVGRRSEHDVLVHTDLHYLNILRCLEPAAPASAPTLSYLAIDPKPMVGDAEFAVAPMLWNRIGDLSTDDPAGHLRQRCADLALAAGLDPFLARDWAVLREVQNALSSVESGNRDHAERSLWVASSLLGRTLPELPAPANLVRP